MDTAKERINKLEDGLEEVIQNVAQRCKRIVNIESRIRDMNDVVKRSNIQSQRGERVRERQCLKSYFPELIKDMNLHIEEAQ